MRGAKAGRVNLPPLRDVIARHGLSASKALGQNFLFDEQLLDRIAAIIAPGWASRCPAMPKAVPWSGEVRMIGRPSVTFTPSSKSSALIGISA